MKKLLFKYALSWLRMVSTSTTKTALSKLLSIMLAVTEKLKWSSSWLIKDWTHHMLIHMVKMQSTMLASLVILRSVNYLRNMVVITIVGMRMARPLFTMQSKEIELLLLITFWVLAATLRIPTSEMSILFNGLLGKASTTSRRNS